MLAIQSKKTKTLQFIKTVMTGQENAGSGGNVASILDFMNSTEIFDQSDMVNTLKFDYKKSRKRKEKTSVLSNKTKASSITILKYIDSENAWKMGLQRSQY